MRNCFFYATGKAGEVVRAGTVFGWSTTSVTPPAMALSSRYASLLFPPGFPHAYGRAYPSQQESATYHGSGHIHLHFSTAPMWITLPLLKSNICSPPVRECYIMKGKVRSWHLYLTLELVYNKIVVYQLPGEVAGINCYGVRKKFAIKGVGYR